MEIDDDEWKNIKEKLEQIDIYCNKIKINSKEMRELIMFSLSSYALAFFLILFTEYVNFSVNGFLNLLIIFILLMFLPNIIILLYLSLYSLYKKHFKTNRNEIKYFDMPFPKQNSSKEEFEILEVKNNINHLIGQLQMTSGYKWRSSTIITSILSLVSGLIVILIYYHLPLSQFNRFAIIAITILVMPPLTYIIIWFGKRILTF